MIEGTSYGPVHGEIVILPSARVTTSESLGIECKVKQVTVKREYFGMDTWVGESGEGIGGAGLTSEGKKKKDIETIGEDKSEKKKREKKAGKKDPAVSKLTPDAVIQRLKMGYSGITCCIDHFGEEGAECFTEGNTIFINRDHPLYQREVKNRDTHILNIARLLTQEISLMKDPKNPRQAFERQSRLLKDAFRK